MALRSTRQNRRRYQAQLPRKKLEHDVHSQKTGGGKNSGNYKEARSYPDVSNRTRSNGHVGQGGVLHSRDVGRKLRQRKSEVDDGLMVSETRDFTNLGAVIGNANTDVHFFNMNKEEFKHMRQSSENTQDGLGRKINGG